jgi:hypothetical protein
MTFCLDCPRLDAAIMRARIPNWTPQATCCATTPLLPREPSRYERDMAAAQLLPTRQQRRAAMRRAGR